MIRFLSLLSFVLWGAVVLLLVTNAESNFGLVIGLIIAAGFLTGILAVRSAYLRAKNLASNVRGFVSGDYQQVRLVSVGEPKGIFSPEAPLSLEFTGADGQTHTYDHDVPIPFPYAWGYRLGKRFNVPGLKQLDPTKLLASELRREGLSVSLSRPTQGT